MADEDERRPGLSGLARWAIVLGAAVALVVAFAALRGGGSGDEPSGQPTAPQATRSRAATQKHATTEDQATTEREAPTRPRVATIRVEGGAPVGGVTKLDVAEGGRIRFRVVADAADAVHLHGYDVVRQVGPGIRAAFDVEATIEGRFEVELHHSGARIARVDVTPS
ncbi:MAG TPA: hypothetical protein VLB47_12460 [Solirubrobacteraceae bacterium]|nr:hypothetical protein [Solirubrobacteraceae bacterium]